MNSVNLIGRLTRDPELKHTAGGTAVCEIRIAVDRAGMKQDDGKYGAGFFNVTVWGDQGERAAEWLSKGREVGVSGELRWREYEASDGSGKRQVTDINGRWLTYVGPRGESTSAAAQTSPATESSDFPVSTDDDIPF